MTGLHWTFEHLVKYTSHPSFPSSTLNPLIKRLLASDPDAYIFGVGGHSVVLRIAPDVAAKVALEPGDEHLRHEQAILASLAGDAGSPHLIRSYLHAADVSFLELVENGNLHERMRRAGRPPRPVLLRWMLQLAHAVACLETLGYAHGDIDPRNILVDAEDQVRLIDFDHALRPGAELDVGEEPYVRQSMEPQGGQFGFAGPVTEQFALGSVFWYMARGVQMYAELPGHERVDRLIRGDFPASDPHDPVDGIIRRCWEGGYATVAHLVDDIQRVSGLELPTRTPGRLGHMQERRRFCEEYCRVANLTVIQSNAKEEEDARFDTASARNNTEKCADLSHAAPLVAGKSSIPMGYQSNQPNRQLPMKTSMLRFRTRAKSMCNFL
ncbi:kinase domain-containing [Cordyceps militaris]|uniref:Kinase domain-containing n=1 Tax=Cordyceps militaris TaxID=73501 RepID=A0A2H4SC96_CORMI|nr:kinase domain-containing [Cordyceps militaris]